MHACIRCICTLVSTRVGTSRAVDSTAPISQQAAAAGIGKHYSTLLWCKSTCWCGGVAAAFYAKPAAADVPCHPPAHKDMVHGSHLVAPI